MSNNETNSFTPDPVQDQHVDTRADNDYRLRQKGARTVGNHLMLTEAQLGEIYVAEAHRKLEASPTGTRLDGHISSLRDIKHELGIRHAHYPRAMQLGDTSHHFDDRAATDYLQANGIGLDLVGIAKKEQSQADAHGQDAMLTIDVNHDRLKAAKDVLASRPDLWIGNTIDVPAPSQEASSTPRSNSHVVRDINARGDLILTPAGIPDEQAQAIAMPTTDVAAAILLPPSAEQS